MEQKDEKETGPAAAIKGLWRWSTTPPQSYPMYVVCLILVLGLSYYAGTLKPKRAVSTAPPSAALPSN
jgi:hypothetical protein